MYSTTEAQLKSLLVLSRNAVSAMIHFEQLEPANKLWIPESLKRYNKVYMEATKFHTLDFYTRRYLLFEDVITKWTTK